MSCTCLILHAGCAVQVLGQQFGTAVLCVRHSCTHTLSHVDDRCTRNGYNIVLLIRAVLTWFSSVSSLQVLGRQCGAAGWPGEQVIVAAAARRYVRAAVKLAARGQFSKRDGKQYMLPWLPCLVALKCANAQMLNLSTCIICHREGKYAAV
jgi:hypothetical protein